MNLLYNKTVNSFLTKIGHEISTHDWHFIQNGWLCGQSNSNHIRGYFGTPNRIIPVTPDQALLLHQLSDADEAAERQAKAQQQAKLDADAEAWQKFCACQPHREVAGCIINDRHEVEDTYGNYLFTLPVSAHKLSGPQLENLILSWLEDNAEGIGD